MLRKGGVARVPYTRWRTGRLAQRESASLTRKRSEVQVLQRPPQDSVTPPGYPSWPALECTLGAAG